MRGTTVGVWRREEGIERSVKRDTGRRESVTTPSEVKGRVVRRVTGRRECCNAGNR
jgi:hypothetical protein